MDTITPLFPTEADRLYTELKRIGKVAKLRELRYYSPDDIAARFDMKPVTVAKMAGRIDGKDYAPIA